MKEITGIDHIGVRIRNFTIAREFYEKLGFEFIEGPMGPEPVAVMEHPSGVNINFIINANSQFFDNILMDIDEKNTGHTHIALGVGDIKSVESNLQNLGIAVSEGPITLPNGAVMLFIRDPDRNVIEFHQPISSV